MAKGKFDMSEFLMPVEGVPESGTTLEIAVDDILDNPRNFYPRPDNAALAELMESIRANGLLEPPTVVPDTDGKYRLISGHSRMAALRLLAANRDEAVAKQFSTVLCRVLPAMTEEQELCAVIEANRGAAGAGGGTVDGNVYSPPQGGRGAAGAHPRPRSRGDAGQQDQARQPQRNQERNQSAGDS